ncbi:hypothetical protein PZA11_006020 [Diplocarpon coronariae]
MPDQFVILGAGVIGLTTALELSTRHPDSSIKMLATHLPGDRHIDYTSPWAGANWLSCATDNGRQEAWDEVTYRKFAKLADGVKEAGVQRMNIQAFYDSEIEQAGILSKGTGRVWYEGMTGLRWLGKGELRRDAVFGYECGTFVVNVQVYLPWLQHECLKTGNVEIRRKAISDISDVFKEYPGAKAVFNCTGLGSYSLKGVEDTSMYPTKVNALTISTFQSPRLVF